MTSALPDPHASMREAAAKARERAEAMESLHLRNLLDNESGRWLLRSLIDTFEFEIRRRAGGHNSEDSYHRGRQDAAREYRDMIVKHFGYAALDKLTKGQG